MLKRSLALLLLALLIVTSIPFSASAANAYWGFDDYDTIVNPGAPAEITSYPTTITKNSASLYTITSVTDAGTLAIQLVEETWGTFNLGSWKLTDKSGKTHIFVDGSTDMEYVHQLYYDASEVTFSGGNHGGEALVSLDFYDGESGSKITLSNGQSKTVNILHVIEKTELLLVPDANNDSIADYTNKNVAYTADQVYAQLTRKYTFTGPQVKLNVDYKYMRDTYHARNYSCMFPINKTYGQYADMFDKDGNLIRTISTMPYGNTTYPQYSGPHNSGNEATRAVVYSENSPYIFDMRVNTYKDSVNEFKDASYKTSFWDMNYYYNKLYFTRFDEGKKVLHAKNSEVHTECIWMFTYDDEGREPTEGEAPVSLNKNYDISVSNDPIVDSEWNTDYSALLTDGKASETFNASNGSWFAMWINRHTDGNGVGSVTVDLTKKYDISKLRIHLANSVSIMGVSAPKSAKAYAVDENGTVIKELGNFTIDTGDSSVYWTTVTPNEKVSARYIKFEITITSPCAYVNEVEVYGTESKEGIDVSGTAKDNILSGLDYNISYTNAPMGAPEYGTSYGALLTDGKAATALNYGDDSWFFFQKGKNASADGVGTVTVELDGYYDITKARVHLANSGAAMLTYAPQYVKLYASLDGESYDEVGSFNIDSTDTIVYWSELNASEAVTAKYIKFEFKINASSLGMFVNELEVYGSESDYSPEPEYAYGDVNGSGKFDMFDYMAVKSYCLGKSSLDEAAQKRADVNSDGKINMFDYLALKSAYFTK